MTQPTLQLYSARIYGDGKTFNPSKLASTRSYKLKSKTESKLNFTKAISDCPTTVDFD